MIVLPLSPSGGNGLSDYLFVLRRLLHDPNDRMYPYADKVVYINKGRERTARDTACCRLMQPGITLTAGTEQYDKSILLPYGTSTVDVLGISVFWGNLKYQLAAMPFQKLDTWLRTWNTFRQRPTSFARYGGTVIYVAPVPDQDYLSDWDTAVVPNDLVDDTSAEVIPIPFQNAVPFFAAFYAKQTEQSGGEADRMLNLYEAMRRNAQATWRRRMFVAPYQE